MPFPSFSKNVLRSKRPRRSIRSVAREHVSCAKREQYFSQTVFLTFSNRFPFLTAVLRETDGYQELHRDNFDGFSFLYFSSFLFLFPLVDHRWKTAVTRL